MQLRLRGALALAAAGLLVTAACGGGTGTQPSGPQLGSDERPIVLAFVPSQETQKILTSGGQIANALAAATGLKFKAEVPVSYAATIEGMCSSKVDLAFLAPLSYVLAKDKGCAQLLLTSVRDGLPTYRGQIRVRTDSGISDLAGLRGKKFAFSDPVSTSGSMYPQLLVKKQFNATAKEFFSDVVFAGGHDKAMLALYNGQVDGAASFIDAKTDVPAAAVGLFPDITQKTKRIAETDDIPGDTVSVRNGLPQDLAERIKSALMDYAKTEAGKKAIFGLYAIDGFAEIPDSTYDVLREGAQIVGLNLEADAARTARPPATPTPTPTRSP